jgi:hypothetical protein
LAGYEKPGRLGRIFGPVQAGISSTYQTGDGIASDNAEATRLAVLRIHCRVAEVSQRVQNHDENPAEMKLTATDQSVCFDYHKETCTQ